MSENEIKSLLKEKYSKIIDFFIKNPNTDFNVNQILKKTKISPSILCESLKELEAKNILISKKVANSIFYALNNENKIIKIIKNLTPEVDYQKRESKAVDAIKKAIPKVMKQNMLPVSRGMFCELFESKTTPNHYIATACDGVGTKLILSEAMHKYDTIGIDLVAMNANDLVTFPPMSPFLFINYIATQAKIQEEGITGDIVKGIIKGLEMCESGGILTNNIHINLGKGETASVDELISTFKPGYGFDVAGAMIGFIEKKKIKNMKKIQPGDKIIALKSSGLHSNGYTDARLYLLNGDFETRQEYKRRYKGRFSLNNKFNNSTIGKLLLGPTKIYVKVINAIAKEFPITCVNNTGYGLKNFNRLKGQHEFLINDPIKPQPIFELIQKESGFDDKKMYQTFNMGMGFFIICENKDADKILKITKKYKEEAKVVGEIKKSGKEKVILEKNNKKIIFEGY